MQGGVISEKIIYSELSYEIVKTLFQVHNELGYGYQEKYYQKALEIAFIKNNIEFSPQCPYKIRFKGEIVGKYYIDFIIENKIVLEIKKGNYYAKSNFDQVYGYLRATGLKLGILANFTREGVKYKRILNIK